LYASLFFLIGNAEIWQHGGISFAITFDFLIFIPALYFLIIRKTSIPNFTVVPVLVLSMVLCGFMLPESQQWYLNGFETWVFPIFELAVISFVVWKVHQVIRTFRESKKEELDFFTALKETCQELVPRRAVMPLVTEISVFYYGFFQWRKRKLRSNEFSYHKSSGAVTLLIAVIGMVSVEMITVHVLLSKWSVIAAWVLTILSVYSGIQIFGFAKAMLQRPIQITEDNLVLRFGILKETSIPLHEIKSIELTTKDLDPQADFAKLSILLAIEVHNLLIHLQNEQEVVGLYGKTASFHKMALHIDDKNRFVEMIESKCVNGIVETKQ
jgi:hypothetical protein